MRPRIIFAALGAIFFIVLGFGFWRLRCPDTSACSLIQLWQGKPPQNSPDNLGEKIYNSDILGLRFRYPDRYLLQVKELGDGHRAHTVITLTENSKENQEVRENRTIPREGPVSISWDIYQSPDQSSLIEWLKNNPDSNFKLSDGNYKEIQIAGAPALYYTWSGLYEADAVVFAHQDYLASVSATYIAPGDPIRKDFKQMLASVELY